MSLHDANVNFWYIVCRRFMQKILPFWKRNQTRKLDLEANLKAAEKSLMTLKRK